MKEYQTYLFDLDGTLISTINLIVKCFQFSLKKYLKVDVSRNAIIQKIGLPLEKQFMVFIEMHGGKVEDFDLQEMAKVHMEYQLSIWKQHVSTYDCALPLLQLLKKRKKKTAIVTSRLIKTASLYLEHVGLKDYFDCVITPENTLKHKPYPEPIFEALKSIGGKADSAVMIGDAEFDIAAAHAAKVDNVWVKHDSQFTISPQPTYIVKDLLEIKNFIENNNI